jgi:hypothetical protein
MSGASDKAKVIAACEKAMLDHVEHLMKNALSQPGDKAVAERFETGLRRIRKLDPVMRQIVDRVYDE